MPENSVVEGNKAIVEKGLCTYNIEQDANFMAIPQFYPKLFSNGSQNHTTTLRTYTLPAECFSWNNPALEVEFGAHAGWFQPSVRKALGWIESEEVEAMPLEPAELICAVRGKEMSFACGLFLMRVHFQTEAHPFWLSNPVFSALIRSGPVPHGKGFTYLLTQEVLDLSRVGSPPPLFRYRDFDADANPPLHCHIFFAFKGKTHTLVFVDHNSMMKVSMAMLPRPCEYEELRVGHPLWYNGIWDARHGPDWIREPEAAEATYANWVIASSTGRRRIEDALTDQRVFNGLGAWLISDVLCLAGIDPDWPLHAIARSSILAERLRKTIRDRLQHYHVPDLPRREGRNQPPQPTSHLPYTLRDCHGELEFNHDANERWLSSVICYRKSIVLFPGRTYKEHYYNGNLLREGFVMSEDGLSAVWPFAHRPPPPMDEKLLPTPKEGPKEIANQTKGSKSKYTPIVALPAPEWFGCSRAFTFSGPAPTAADEARYYDRLRVATMRFMDDKDDVRFETGKTTLGLYNFRTYVQLRVEPSKTQIEALKPRAGRPRKGKSAPGGGGQFKGRMSSRAYETSLREAQKQLTRRGASKLKKPELVNEETEEDLRLVTIHKTRAQTRLANQL